MALGVLGQKNTYVYLSDNLLSYLVNHLVVKASPGGFSIGPASGGRYPYPSKYMRTALAVVQGSGEADQAPIKVELPIATPDHPLWVGSSSSFTISYPNGSYNYVVTGRRGERRYRLNSA